MFKVLDLFCCAGGAAMGLHMSLDANGMKHTITGIDKTFQPRYPFNKRVKDINEMSWMELLEYDFIWASPPCQKYSLLKYVTKKEYPDMIPFTREILEKSGKPYVMENVEPAPLRKDLLLCGEMFGLKIFRHRIFEVNFDIIQPVHYKHKGSVKHGDYLTLAGSGCGKSGYIDDWQRAIGINWVRDKHMLAEAVPPAYSCYIMDNYLNRSRI